MYKKTTTLAMACLAGCAAAAANVKPTEGKTIDASTTFNMRYVKEDEQVEFIVTMPKSNSWVGLVLGATIGEMKADDDMVIFFGDGL